MFSKNNERDIKNTAEYRERDLTPEVITNENQWRLINFMSCLHRTAIVRNTKWHPPSRKYYKEMSIYDGNFQFLSKLLKCIVFVQDMNRSTKESEVLGDHAQCVSNKALGEPIFTGSSEEGLALMATKKRDPTNDFDQIDYLVQQDFDIMYESKQMVSYEINSLRDIQPISSCGKSYAIMRPGSKAGYITLQKCFPPSREEELRDGSVNFNSIKICPKLEEYFGQEYSIFAYINALAYLVTVRSEFLGRSCVCSSAYEDGRSPNRHGDLCCNCKIASKRTIHREKDKTATNIWSHSLRISGPAIAECAIVENDPEKTTVPETDAEYEERLERLHDETDLHENLLPCVKPTLSDIFSSSGRKSIFIDHVPVIKCFRWPSAAWEFEVRNRPSGWPSECMVQKIVSRGCHVVPRSTYPPPGTKLRQDNSAHVNTTTYEDWRISFSLAEKFLTSTFNEAQVKCFLFLKVVNELIAEELYARRQEVKRKLDLSSYHLKTTFFWVCEEINKEEWTDDNIGKCIFKVVEKLVVFLKKGVIPNYFIPSCNLIDDQHPYDASEFSSDLNTFRAKKSEGIFESIHKFVWHKIWENSEVKPPGSTPKDLKKIMKALKKLRKQNWIERQNAREDEKPVDIRHESPRADEFEENLDNVSSSEEAENLVDDRDSLVTDDIGHDKLITSSETNESGHDVEEETDSLAVESKECQNYTVKVTTPSAIDEIGHGKRDLIESSDSENFDTEEEKKTKKRRISSTEFPKESNDGNNDESTSGLKEFDQEDEQAILDDSDDEDNSDLSSSESNDFYYDDSEDELVFYESATLDKSDIELNQVLGEIFKDISIFLRENGNVYGIGFNTSRAAFYEKEAEKLENS